MGIFSGLFNKNNRVGEMNEQHSNRYTKDQSNSLKLKYKSGTECTVEFSKFREIIFNDGSKRVVQEVILTYLEKNGEFYSRTVVVDPCIVQTKQGNIYATEQHYKELSKQNMALVKGFFQKEQLSEIRNGYIGHISYNTETGIPYRAFEPKIKDYFNLLLSEKNLENSFKNELRENTYTREVKRMASKKEVYVEKNPEAVLTKADYEKYYGDR